MSDVKKFPVGTEKQEVVAIEKELQEFWSDPELASQDHQRWYLTQISLTAPLSRQRQSARRLLYATVADRPRSYRVAPYDRTDS